MHLITVIRLHPSKAPPCHSPVPISQTAQISACLSQKISPAAPSVGGGIRADSFSPTSLLPESRATSRNIIPTIRPHGTSRGPCRWSAGNLPCGQEMLYVGFRKHIATVHLQSTVRRYP
ncbi:hypothetical protein WOLCODRAFT_68746 [Wolfiporia cocos MD-104 SS10]|uniref:Uncharacterized protein n=1 Tax=Wolfiporia cocos (strain MD-104) TaxID=742152 RepID=A0A2H3JDW1_WOLCO|nr:hypothetical protein WOLCODRAFT_68746 [Wolfiporia cocos MD-104 SS10]